MKKTTVLVAAFLVLVGCSGSDATTTESASPSATAPTCPNPFDEGGSCLGELQPGESYTTREFDPAITYSVPAAGWHNYEDLYGNFLLVPPGQRLEDDPDYIGVYRSLTPTRTVGPACHEETRLRPGQQPTVRGMWDLYAADPLLRVSSREPVSVGGRDGVAGRIEVRPGVRLPQCRDGGQVIRLVGLFAGSAGSDLAHSVAPGGTMRLYLLRDGQHVLGIEVYDVHAAPASLKELTAVAESLQLAD